jgi:hypothetical protein
LAIVNRLTPLQVQEQLIAARKRQAALDQMPWVVNYGPYNWRVPATRTLWQRQAYARFNGQQRDRGPTLPDR